MSKFIQIHYLTSYPASNLNRDDLGRPKTVNYGGKNRIRISSQCLKRTWRTSNEFVQHVGGNGKRTRQVCIDIYKEKIYQFPEKSLELIENLKEIKKYLSGDTGNKKDNSIESLQLGQLVYLSNSEIDYLKRIVHEAMSTNVKIKDILLNSNHLADADVAMFGRMFAANPSLDIEGAVQVSHAFTVHESQVESDYFTAIDDIVSSNKGSAHIGEKEFGSGLFYGYLCINYDLLLKNLNNDEQLAKKAVKGIINSAAKTSPSGSQNSYGARSLASFVAIELGEQQPRSFAHAFLKPVLKDYEESSLHKINELKNQLDEMYPEMKNVYWEAALGKGSLTEAIENLFKNI